MIRVLAMDVDGTLTDGKLYFGPNGEIMKVFDIKDGYGIKDLCPKHNIIPIIITGRESEIVNKRFKELSVEYIHQNIKSKEKLLLKISNELNINLSDFAYIGDDLNDKGAIELINTNNGISACPANAHKEIIEIVDFVSKYGGGNGAVRDFIEYIVDKNL